MVIRMKVKLIAEETAGKRIELGLARVEKSLRDRGFEVFRAPDDVSEPACKAPGAAGSMPASSDDASEARACAIYIGVRGKSEKIKYLEEQGLLLYHSKAPSGEGFYLTYLPGDRLIVVVGGSETGALYGALELAERIRKEKSGRIVAADLAFGDEPVFRLRGPAVGLQLTKVEPPRLTYEYPITPARFPWFYDKAMWEKFLDQMLLERCNVFYIWTGQPFSSLVKLADYPEALEVTEEEYEKNREMFGWLTEECDRRGIWLVLKFYSIHIPLPLAEKHHVELLQSNITELNADYTYKSIVEFIKSFPHIGLMVCLGEALRGTQNKTDWFMKTILPAVKEGVRQAGLTEEPPLILRGHDCDPNAIMEQAVHEYGNLYTMWKYNGESLTTYLPSGKWQDTHVRLSSHGQTHIMNVHVVANLEPFRYAAPGFIRKCMQAGQNRLGGSGLHLYPLFFWDWPYSADKAEPRLLQMDRDWMWYAAWFRYAWNPNRNPETEKLYWQNRLAEHFGCGAETAEDILLALEAAGQCAPRILRRVGITEGNRQTMSLGMTMSQFTNVKRYRPNYELWHSASTPGEQPDDYIRKELAGEAHYGETPYDMMEEVSLLAQEARAAIHRAKGKVEAGRERELDGYITDIEAIWFMTMSYVRKLEAAHRILQYKYTMNEKLRGDLALLEAALAPWEESLDLYRQLAALTEKTYLYANSMQTPQRKIPFPNGETFGHWAQCLPEYELEFENFKKNLENMKNGKYPCDGISEEEEADALPQAPFKLLDGGCGTYTVRKGEMIFTDMASPITNAASELKGLTGIRFGLGEAIGEGVTVRIEFSEDSQLLLAYMNAKGVEWLQVPDLETNTHADDRGGLNAVFVNAMQAEGCPDMNIHVFQYEKGVHEIYMGTGGYTIVGVVPAGVEIRPRNAGLSGETLDKLDWLYEPVR